MVDAVALIVGIVVGAGIFRTPSLVAANAGGVEPFLAAWILGGAVSLIGALCYAELATAFPSTGGDYHFLGRAFGKNLAFLYAWARMSVIQTGSIALLAFIFGDYLTQIYSFGSYSSVIYAGLSVTALTAINIIGLRFGTGAQKLLTTVEILGVLLIIVVGFSLAPSATASEAPTSAATTSFGLMMVFVLLTFGGWNEAAYISAELREGRTGKRPMAVALIVGIAIITVLYLLVNLAYLNALGLGGMAGSEAVAVDLMRTTFGSGGVLLIGVLVGVSALTSANATIFTGARTNYAMGRDFPVFASLGKWNARASAPVNAFLVQGLIALGLVALGLFTRKGFETIVEYTAPVFWFFFLLVGVALFVLRRKEPDVERAFRVPLYPLTPLLFCLTSAYLLYSSLVYTGFGAFVGVAVLLAGALLLAVLPAIENFRQANRSRGIKMRSQHFRIVFALTLTTLAASCMHEQTAVSNTAVAPVADPTSVPSQKKELDVPYVPTHEMIVEEMLRMAEVKGDDVLYDLGSGDGRIPITAAKQFGTHGVGIDLDPERVNEANQNAKKAGVTDKVKFIEGDIFKSDFREASVVTLYLLPEINLRLRPQLLEQLKPGTRVVSHNYHMGDWQPEQTKTITTPDGVDHFIYFWRVPDRKG